MSAMPQFKKNALGWLDSYIKGETEQSPKAKIQKRSANQYLDRCEQLEFKFANRTDFSEILDVFPQNLIGFNQGQKAEIDWFVNKYLQSAQECAFFLALWARAYSSFLDVQGDPVAKTLVDAYEYFRTKAFERFPELKVHYLKMKGKTIEKTEEKASRPLCCGSPMSSSGKNFVCGTCGRSQVKNPRKAAKSQRPESIRRDGRPRCPNPECGSYRVVSNGKTLWKCKICGRQFLKERKK